MAEVFPGLELSPPLFYKWPVALRFALGADQDGMTYDQVVMHRACILYEAAFSARDLAFIASGQTRYVSMNRGGCKTTHNRYRRYVGDVFHLSKRYCLGLAGPSGRQRLITDQDGKMQEKTTVRWTEIASRSVKYKKVLEAKANADYYPHRPRTNDEVYFVNCTRGIILHMYDDRGMDILAARRSELQPIYEAHRDWTLDYDRVRMQKLFDNADGPAATVTHRRSPT